MPIIQIIIRIRTLFRSKCLSLGFEDYILRKIAQDETRVSYLKQKKNCC